jgi:predicted amidophosphoribosyltransferase
MIHTPALLRFGFPQMNFHGCTDLLGAITHEPEECTDCQTAMRLSNRLCLRCLLQVGLTEDEDPGSDSMDALLSEMK